MKEQKPVPLVQIPFYFEEPTGGRLEVIPEIKSQSGLVFIWQEFARPDAADYTNPSFGPTFAEKSTK